MYVRSLPFIGTAALTDSLGRRSDPVKRLYGGRFNDPLRDPMSSLCIIESKGSTNVIYIYFQQTNPVEKGKMKKKKKDPRQKSPWESRGISM